MAQEAPAAPRSDAARESLPAPLGRRVLCLLYETLLLAAVLWCAALPLQLMEVALDARHSRTLLQLYLLAVTGAYFVWQWTRGGQTLAMKTWRLRVADAAGGPVSPKQAIVRYVAAVAGVALFGAGFLWALFDRERRFLHDRLAGTRIVTTS